MADDDQDTGLPSDAAESDPLAYCATCMTGLNSGSWHPTISHTDQDETYHIVRFCSDECREEWCSTRADRDGS